jgi:hypothetical protein
MIGVKNTGEREIVSRYDGKDYRFPPDVAVAISPDAATHIFGFGLEDKSRALGRLGWLRNQAQYADAVKRLDTIQFLRVENKFDEPAELPKTVMASPSADESKMETGARKSAPPATSAIDIPQFNKAAK